MELAAIIIIFLATVGFVGWPLMRPKEAIVHDPGELEQQRSELVEEKERLLNDIKDLELSYSLGKITAQDYSPLASKTKKQAAAVLREIDTLDGLLGKGESQPKAKKQKKQKQKPKQKALCANCGWDLAHDDAFCRKCGHKVE